MNIFYYIAPLILIIISNTIYHLISKNTSTSTNPFAALVVTYGIAFLGSVVIFLTTKKTSVSEEIANLKLSNYILGLVIIGVEGGYLLMYKMGWELRKGPLIANICIAIILLFIGIILINAK